MTTTELTYAADIRIGQDANKQQVTIPLPGMGGRHLLIGGATGAGKSECLNGIFSELAPRPHLAIVGCDPKRVELSQWVDRASLIAKGRTVCNEALRLTVKEMSRRYHFMDEQGLQNLPIGDPACVCPKSGEPWPYILSVYDELADLSRHDGTQKGRAAASRRMALLEEMITMGRAAGMGLILCTQRPSAGAVPLEIRDNCRVRLAFGCESWQQADMILGDRPAGVAPHELDESMPGLGWLKRDRKYTMLRTYQVRPGGARHVAEQYATLRINMDHLGWPGLLVDPLPLDDEEEIDG